MYWEREIIKNWQIKNIKSYLTAFWLSYIYLYQYNHDISFSTNNLMLDEQKHSIGNKSTRDASFELWHKVGIVYSKTDLGITMSMCTIRQGINTRQKHFYPPPFSNTFPYLVAR